MTPLITAILYLSDDATYVEDTIASLRAQTLSNFDCIVVEDAVRDRSALRALHAIGHDPRFKLLHNNMRLGAGASRNRALEKARGRYVCFPSSEDYLEPSFFEEAASVFSQHPNIVVTGMTHTFFNHKNELARQKQIVVPKDALGKDVITFMLSLFRARLFSPIYNKFFERSFLPASCFETTPNKPTQDFIFQLEAFQHATSFACVSTTGYHFMHHVGEEAQLVRSNEAFLENHRRVALVYELLEHHGQLNEQTKAQLQGLYEEDILDELVRQSMPALHISKQERKDWVRFLKEDPLFQELVEKGETPKGMAPSRLHKALVASRPEAALRYAHFVEYARSFGPSAKARVEK